MPQDDPATDLSRRRLLQSAGVASTIPLAGCDSLGGSGDPTGTVPSTDTATTTGTDRDPAIQRRLEELSLREKAGQMTLVALNGQASSSTVRSLIAGQPCDRVCNDFQWLL